jgi:hypothetical protein
MWPTYRRTPGTTQALPEVTAANDTLFCVKVQSIPKYLLRIFAKRYSEKQN